MLMLLTGLQLLVVGLVADGVIRRIAQQAVAQVPSRAIRTLGEDDDPRGVPQMRRGGARE
jgi:hypothetical protein